MRVTSEEARSAREIIQKILLSTIAIETMMREIRSKMMSFGSMISASFHSFPHPPKRNLKPF